MIGAYKYIRGFDTEENEEVCLAFCFKVKANFVQKQMNKVL